MATIKELTALVEQLIAAQAAQAAMIEKLGHSSVRPVESEKQAFVKVRTSAVGLALKPDRSAYPPGPAGDMAMKRNIKMYAEQAEQRRQAYAH